MVKKLLTLLLCALIAPAFSKDIAPAVMDGSVWQLDLTGFAHQFSRARFARVDDETLRFPRQAAITLDELGIGELIISFDGESKQICLLQASVYNKGDDGEIGKNEFESLVTHTAERLDALTGVKGKARKVLQRDSGVKLEAMVWQTEHGAILLESAGNGSRRDFAAEFIRLTIGPDTESLKRGGARDAARRNDLKVHKKVDDNGDVWIEGIPMVDQGQKGYCVPATVSRVFAYYGMDGVDQHALAALCKSTGDRGTSMEAMESALKDISRRFHIKVIELDKGGMSAFISAYNTTAKKMKKPALTPRMMMLALDPSVLLAAHADKPTQIRKWMKPIMKSIDAGLPVLWSVLLAFPEQGMPQMGGGHMRLIIGYNEQEGTIIYSDTWGARHVRKEMPVEQAAAMTVYRYILRPTR